MPDEALIQDRMANPPADTRAALRGAAVAALSDPDMPNPNNKVDWKHIICRENGVATQYMLDPFDTEHHELEALLGRLSQRR